MSVKAKRKRIVHVNANIARTHKNQKYEILATKVKKQGIRNKYNVASTD